MSPAAGPAESLRLEDCRTALDALELRDCVPSPRGPLYFLTWRG